MSDGEAHSRIGASSAKRWINCPGSIVLCEDAPDEKPSRYAAEGTVAHGVGEEILLRWLDTGKIRSPHKYIGKKREADGFKFTVTEEMADAVAVYVDFITERFNPKEKKAKCGVEARIHLKHINEDMFGTIDWHFASFKKRKLTVIDYKHGAGVVVEVEDNEQILYYLLGVVQKYKAANFDEMEVFIAQPRVDHEDGPVRGWKVTKKKLLKFERILKSAIKRVEDAKANFDPDIHLNPGSWCGFCKAAGFCPKLREKAVQSAVADFDELNDDIEDIYLTPPHQMAPEMLNSVLKASETMQAWISAVWKFALMEAQAGRAPKGFKLVEKSGHRKFPDEKKVIEKAELAGYDTEQFYAARKLKSPAQIEKIKGVGKNFTRGLTETPSAGASLKPVGHKKLSIASSAISDFSDYKD